MTSLQQILDEQDARDLHGQTPAVARVNHLGLSSRTVSEVFAAVRGLHRPAVRSGHVGNWNEIWRGQVGLIDYNRYICRDLGMGRPLLHAHTFTETGDLAGGDAIYLPAGTIEDHRYRRLPIHVKEGVDFRAISDTESVCCAFAFVPAPGGMTPLVQVRADEFAHIASATTIPTLLTGDTTLLRAALDALLDATADPEVRLPLDHVFGSSVNRQGQRGGPPQPSSGGFIVEGTRYDSRKALVEAGIEALAHGSLHDVGLHARSAPRNEFLPLLGATAVLALVAAVDCRENRTDIHAHWGAISMSGYPPLAGGYFGRRATRRTLRELGEALSAVPELVLPLRFALLPAPILSLLPPAEFDTDCQLAELLIRTVLESTDLPASDPSGALGQINGVVDRWLTAHGSDLSDYYVNRFGRARSVHNGTQTVPSDGAPSSAQALGELTMQQASMVLGALITATSARQDVVV